MLEAAYRRAGVSPGRVRYVEAHGTGTKLGDPIEMKALAAVLARGRAPGEHVRGRLGQDEHRPPGGRRGDRRPDQGRPLARAPADPAEPALRDAEPVHPVRRDPACGCSETLGRWPRGDSPRARRASAPSASAARTPTWCSPRRRERRARSARGRRRRARPSPVPVGDDRRRPCASWRRATRPTCATTRSFRSGTSATRPRWDDRTSSTVSRSVERRRRLLVRLLEAAAAGQPAPSDVERGEVTGRKRPRVAFVFTGRDSSLGHLRRQLYRVRARLPRGPGAVCRHPSVLARRAGATGAARRRPAGRGAGRRSHRLLPRVRPRRAVGVVGRGGRRGRGARASATTWRRAWPAACSLEDGLRLAVARGRLVRENPRALSAAERRSESSRAAAAEVACRAAAHPAGLEPHRTGRGGRASSTRPTGCPASTSRLGSSGARRPFVGGDATCSSRSGLGTWASLLARPRSST